MRQNKTSHLDRIHRPPQADHAQRVVLPALHLVLALLPHGPRQPLSGRVFGLGGHRGDAHGLVRFPVGLLAGLAAVVGDLALGALLQRRAPALHAAEEAAEQVDPQDGLVALRLRLADVLLLLLGVLLFLVVRCLAAGPGFFDGVLCGSGRGQVVVT